MAFCILTSWNHRISLAGGLALIAHSKEILSPSLILLKLNFGLLTICTSGLSENSYFKINSNYYDLEARVNIFQIIEDLPQRKIAISSSQ